MNLSDSSSVFPPRDFSRPLDPEPHQEEIAFEPALRPRYLSEYIGQDEIKSVLELFIKAARMRAEPLDHCLLHGHPGLGKTTLAHIIASELGVGIRCTSGPVIESLETLRPF